MWELIGILVAVLILGVPLVALILSLRANYRLSRVEKNLEILKSQILTQGGRTPDKAPVVSVPVDSEEERVPCPLCGEPIKRAANKCIHCKAFVNTGEPVQEIPTDSSLKSPTPEPPPPVVALEKPPVPTLSKAPDEPQPAAKLEAGALERVVGERILSGLGILILVVGVSLLLWYSFTKLGAAGKVFLAGGTGIGMIVFGAFLLNRAKYLIPGGCLVAGGWAVTYATGYAAHHLEAARVISSATLGFFLVLGIGTGSILHALRFRKEWVGALAYGLLFLTFFLFEVKSTGKLALLPIAVSFVLLVWKLRWIHLGTMGVTILYLLVFLSSGSSPTRSGLFLLLLWGMMSAIPFLYKGNNEREEILSAFFSLINMVGFVGCGLRFLNLFGFEQYWWLFASCGVLYAIQSEFSLRRKSTGTYGVFMVGTVILLTWTGAKLFSPPWEALSWMGLALGILLYGMKRRHFLPRFLAHLLLLCACFKTWFLAGTGAQMIPLGNWEISVKAIPALVGALLLFGHASISFGLSDKNKDEKRTALLFFPWMGAVALATTFIVYSPSLGTALLLSGAALLLVEAGKKFSSSHLQGQGFLFCLCAFGFVSVVNLNADGSVYGISKRLLSIVPVLGIWFYNRNRIGESPFHLGSILSVGFLVGVLSLLRFELGAVGTPFTWGLVSIIWIVCGMYSRSGRTLLEGTVTSLATVVYYGSISQPQIPFSGMGGTAVVGIPIAISFLVLHMWIRKGLLSREEGFPLVWNLVRAGMTLSLVSILFLVLARSVEGTWLTGSWALLSVALAIYGFLLRDRMCRWSSLLVLAICIGKLFLFDFGSFIMPVKIATTMAVGGCMVAISILYARNRDLLAEYFTKE